MLTSRIRRKSFKHFFLRVWRVWGGGGKRFSVYGVIYETSSAWQEGVHGAGGRSDEVRQYHLAQREVNGASGRPLTTDDSIQTWALEEARRRLEAEGILPDPDDESKKQT